MPKLTKDIIKKRLNKITGNDETNPVNLNLNLYIQPEADERISAIIETDPIDNDNTLHSVPLPKEQETVTEQRKITDTGLLTDESIVKIKRFFNYLLSPFKSLLCLIIGHRYGEEQHIAGPINMVTNNKYKICQRCDKTKYYRRIDYNELKYLITPPMKCSRRKIKINR